MNKELGDGGIIFIRMNDYTIKNLLELTGLNYNIIGFYYITESNLGKNSYNFILIDVIGISGMLIKCINYDDFVNTFYNNSEYKSYKRVIKNNADFISKVKKYKFDQSIQSIQKMSKREHMINYLNNDIMAFK